MMKLIQGTIKSFSMAALVLGSLISVQLLMERAHAISDPPKRGTPIGTSTSTTTRPGTTCPMTTKKLTALVANKGSDFTLSASPTLWVYVPYPPNSVSSIELSIHDSTQRKKSYTKLFKVSQTPGFTAIQVPSSGPNAFPFQTNQNYRWYIKLNCKSTQNTQPDTQKAPDAEVSGWIQQKATTPALKQQLAAAGIQRYKVYQQNKIWYDAIDSLAKEHFKDPKNQSLKKAWMDLLKELQVEN